VKHLLCILLIVWMGMKEVKEIEMALTNNLPKQDKIAQSTARKTVKPPAWLGKLGGGMGTNYSPANPNFQEPLSNTGLTDATLPEWMKPRPPAYGGSYNPTNNPDATLPEWMKPRPPAYGGSYNPTNMVTQPGQWNVPAWMGGDAETRDIQQIASGEPVLEDMPTYPFSQTHPYGGVAPLPPPPIVSPPPIVAPLTSQSRRGFGSSYGGNWGGGGGDGYGYGTPAWLANMGLYSWRFGR
jgi:hypothetical protein